MSGQWTVEDFDGMTCEYRDTLEPLDAGDTPASPGPLPPGGGEWGMQDDAHPGPTQRWPYGSAGD